jgi:hypothetical protein
MTIAAKTVDIIDLRSPVLTQDHLDELAYWEENPIDLSVDQILDAARADTGLKDFGPPDFRGRLRQQIKAVNDDTKRTAFGRAEFFNECVRHASTRLKLYSLLRKHPEINDIVIERPVVLIGPPRSGTTHLVNLLAADVRLRSLSVWESREPVIFGPGVVTDDPLDPRYRRCAAEWQRTKALLPHFSAMHPMDPDRAHVDEALLGPDFPVRLWDDEYDDETSRGHVDGSQHYEFLLIMLKVLQWQRSGERWVLRAHFHAKHLHSLLNTFPDATVVMTHRDPVAMARSAAIIFCYMARLNYMSVDIDSLIRRWLDDIESHLRAYIRDRHLVPDERLVDVYFDDFMKDKIGTACRIYSASGLELGSEQRDLMVDYLARYPRYKDGRVSCDLESLGNFDPADVRQRFKFYSDRFLGT